MTQSAQGFFDPHQRATIDAAMARIVPSDDTPGAREAGAVDFVDRYLSGIGYIYAKPDGSGFEQLTGRQADSWQKRVDLARRKYAEGVVELDRRSRGSHDCDFAELAPEQQDDILRSLENPDRQEGAGASRGERPITYGGPVEPALQQTNAESDLDFFPLLVTHTRQGWLSDPIYGGNRGQVGWKTIGFPGPSSLAEVHQGRYSTLEYFADDRNHPGQEADSTAHAASTPED